MKKFTLLLSYLKGYQRTIGLYLLFTVLSILFSVISLGMLLPFLDALFYPDKRVNHLEPFTWSRESLENIFGYYSTQLVNNYGPLMALTAICIIIALAILLKNLFLYLSLRTIIPAKTKIFTDIRSSMYNKVLKLPIGYFTEQRKGDLLSRFSNDVMEIEGSILNTFEGLVTQPLTILVYLVVLIFMSPQLSLFLLIFLPLTALIIGRVSRKLKKDGNSVMQRFGENLSTVEETLGGLRVIKAFNAEKVVTQKFEHTNNEVMKMKNYIFSRTALASPLTEFMGILVICCILWFGGKLVLESGGQATLTASALIAYIVFFSQIINPAKTLSASFYSLRKGSAAVARVNEIINAPVTVVEKQDGVVMNEFKNAIEFKNVSFMYEDVTILKNINLTIQKGKTIALVGSSGAGKSTLADLVPRFHDVSEGELLIDGVNIKEFTLQSLRNHIGIVTQEPILFNDTIANNITLGKANAIPEQVEHAAKVANAWNFIQQKEEGLATNIGERGNKLSGGERQRITIARAVLKNPPILILDEATSSLDTESERMVQDAINNLMKERTSIVIAHRLSTIRHADEIIVLQKGEIVERGTHDSLIQQNGFYKRLVNMQEVK